MKFDNAFKCKNGIVGMQFTYGKGAVISVFHDGESLKVSEDHLPVFQQQALSLYFKLSPRYSINIS